MSVCLSVYLFVSCPPYSFRHHHLPPFLDSFPYFFLPSFFPSFLPSFFPSFLLPTSFFYLSLFAHIIYQIKHPEVVTELVLRGIFLVRKQEINWLYQGPGEKLFLFSILENITCDLLVHRVS